MSRFVFVVLFLLFGFYVKSKADTTPPLGPIVPHTIGSDETTNKIKIHKIKIRVENKKFDKLRFLTSDYLGKVDTPDIRAKLISELEEALVYYGYTHSKIDFKVFETGSTIIYSINIFVEQMCRINHVHLSFENRSGVMPLNKRGDICNISQVKDKIRGFLKKLKDRGFKNSAIKLSRVEYSDDKKYADIYLSGDLGNRYFYRVIERTPTNLITGLWGINPLKDTKIEYASNSSVQREIKKFYLERGYYDVIVENPKNVRGEGDTVEVVFYVDPGFRYMVGNISFIGNKNFSKTELLDQSSGFKIKENLTLYNETAYDNYLKELKDFYFSHGFWDVKVRASTSKNFF